jgi:hypothetical protein
MSRASLVGFDWKLHFVVASDSAAAVNAPLLRLQLFVAGARRGAARAAAARAQPPKPRNPQAPGSDHAGASLRRRRRGARVGALARAA